MLGQILGTGQFYLFLLDIDILNLTNIGQVLLQLGVVGREVRVIEQEQRPYIPRRTYYGRYYVCGGFVVGR